MDLKTKLALALVSACLLSMGALGTFTWVWVEGMFQEEAERRLDARAESRKDELRRVLGSWERDVQALVTRADLPQLMARHLQGEDAASLGRITRAFELAQASDPAIRRLALFDVGGQVLAGVAADPPASEIAADGVVVYVGARGEGSDIGFVFRAPIAADGERLGLVEVEFSASGLDPIVGPTPDVGETGDTLVVVAAESRSTGEGERVIARPPRGAASRAGNEVMAARRALPESGFEVVVQMDAAEVNARSDRLRKDMSDLGLALAAFAILAGTLLGFRLARPIQRLVENVDRIRHGEIGLRLEVDGEDEVAFLAMSLNEFMDQLDRSSDLFQLGELEVLLVDGDARSRRTLQELLENWNLRPTLAESLGSALRTVREAERKGEPFQLILLDESTTDTDGSGLAGALRSSDWHPCPIITLSGTAGSPTREFSAEPGVGRTLPKPVIASHLMEAILDEMGVSAEGLAATADTYLRKTTPRKILLAEDSRLIQQVMLGFLEGWGHEVTCVGNGRLAVERAQAERFDLVLMDVEMPEMNGLDATAAIRAQEGEGERVPIIALTAEARPGDRDRCLVAGMDDYIAKPADPKRLYAMINRCRAQALAGEPARDAAPVPPVAEAAPAGGEDPVDWELARSMTGGDAALLQEVIELFPEESRGQLDAIRLAVDAADAEGVTRNAHSLKGAAKLFGAPALVELAFEVEELGRAGRLAEVPGRLDALRVETARLVAAFARPRTP
jgi:CheY-like chemotaxis protein/HPt (histidine-containing phosphotransfer) domain-containing protein/HAMP domain-containing protein